MKTLSVILLIWGSFCSSNSLSKIIEVEDLGYWGYLLVSNDSIVLCDGSFSYFKVDFNNAIAILSTNKGNSWEKFDISNTNFENQPSTTPLQLNDAYTYSRPIRLLNNQWDYSVVDVFKISSFNGFQFEKYRLNPPLEEQKQTRVVAVNSADLIVQIDTSDFSNRKSRLHSITFDKGESYEMLPTMPEQNGTLNFLSFDNISKAFLLSSNTHSAFYYWKYGDVEMHRVEIPFLSESGRNFIVGDTIWHYSYNRKTLQYTNNFGIEWSDPILMPLNGSASAGGLFFPDIVGDYLVFHDFYMDSPSNIVFFLFNLKTQKGYIVRVPYDLFEKPASQFPNYFVSTAIDNDTFYISLGWSTINETTVRYLVTIDMNPIISSVEVKGSENFSVSPNPVSDLLKLSIPSGTQGLLQVVSSSGQILHSTTLDTHTGEAHSLFVKDYPPGVYFAVLTTPTGTHSQKFVKIE